MSFIQYCTSLTSPDLLTLASALNLTLQQLCHLMSYLLQKVQEKNLEGVYEDAERSYLAANRYH